MIEHRFKPQVDEQGCFLPLSPEQHAAQTVAMAEAFEAMAKIEGDDPELSDEAYLRLLNRKYEDSARWEARQQALAQGGIARRWLRGFSSTLASSGLHLSTRKIRGPRRLRSGSAASNSEPTSASLP